MLAFRTVLGGVARRWLSGSNPSFHLVQKIKLDTSPVSSFHLPLLTQVGNISDKRTKNLEPIPITAEELTAFAEELREWRCQNQLTCLQVSERLGMSMQRYARFERCDMTLGAMQYIALLVINMRKQSNWHQIGSSDTKAQLLPNQVAVLEENYTKNQQLTHQVKRDIAKQLDIDENRVKMWFHNRRVADRALAKRSGEIDKGAEELRQFAVDFRRRRAMLGISQGEVAKNIGRYGQGTLSRFEAQSLTLSTMQHMRPVLQNWIESAEANANIPAIETKYHPTLFLSEDKKETLSKFIENNPKPSVAEKKAIAKEVGLDYVTVHNHVWRNSYKKSYVKNMVNPGGATKTWVGYVQ